MPPVWLLLSMLPLFQTFIIDYNYVCSLVPIIDELLLQYLVRNEIGPTHKCANQNSVITPAKVPYLLFTFHVISITRLYNI